MRLCMSGSRISDRGRNCWYSERSMLRAWLQARMVGRGGCALVGALSLRSDGNTAARLGTIMLSMGMLAWASPCAETLYAWLSHLTTVRQHRALDPGCVPECAATMGCRSYAPLSWRHCHVVQHGSINSMARTAKCGRIERICRQFVTSAYTLRH